MANSLEELLMTKVDTLPEFDFSPVLNEALHLLEEPDADIDKLAQVISKDKHLSNTILNKTIIESNRNVQNVQQAIRLVGMKTVKSFLSATSAAEGKNAGVDAATFEIMQGRLMTHSQLVALCTQLLAQETGYPNQAQAYTAGLFHDLGEAILNAFAFEELSGALKLTQAKAIAMHTAEDRALGFNHAYFSAKIVERWGMPPAIVEPIRLHHTPREAQINKRLTKLLHLADVAMKCQQTKLPLGITLFPLDKEVLAEMPFDKNRLMEIANQAADLHALAEKATASA